MSSSGSPSRYGTGRPAPDPEVALVLFNGRLSDRRASASDLARAFWVERTFTSHAKNGLVALSRGVDVQVPTRLFGKSVTIRFDPVDPQHAELLDRDRVLSLKPYQTKDPCQPPPVAPTEERGVGQLQKLRGLGGSDSGRRCSLFA